MVRNSYKVTDPYADVWLEPVRTAHGDMENRKAVMIKDDDGIPQHIEVVSGDYKLYTNEVVRQIGNDIMTRSQYKWNPLKRYWNPSSPKSLTDMFITEERVVPMPNERDDIKLGVAFRNAYDGSSLLSVELFLCYLACANQWIARNVFGFFALRHVVGAHDEIDIIDAVEQVTTGAERMARMAPVVGELLGTDLTVDRLVECRNKILLPDQLWGRVIERLGKEQKTEFGLLQSMTAVASHDMKTMSALNYSDRIGTYFLGEKLKELEAA